MFKNTVYLLVVTALVFCSRNVFSQAAAETARFNPAGTILMVDHGKSTAVIRPLYSIKIKAGDVLFHGSVMNGIALTVINDKNPQAIVCSIDKDARKISIGDTVYSMSSKSGIKPAGNESGAAESEKKVQKKERIRVLDETKFSAGAFARRSDYRSYSTLYTDNGSQGVLGGYFNLRDRGNVFEFQYKRPQFSGKNKSTDEYSGEGRFGSFLDQPNNIFISGKAGFHYLKDAKDFDTSSYASAKLSLSAADVFSNPEVSYEQKYYLDDYGGDRKKTGDYTASLRVRPLKDILPDIFKTNFTLYYASENYAEKKSTSVKEGKRGFRDFSSELYMDERYLRAGVLWSRIIDNDWVRITGKHQLDFYAVIKADLDELKINLRYDYLKQADSTILKKKKKHLAEAEAVYMF